jgi:exopolysaccharide production protein ExoZ
MSSNKIINSIQFLRGFAALAVVIHHVGGLVKRYYVPHLLFNDYFGIGFAGVDLFFVISGFIIHFTSHKYLNNPNKLGEYFKKRFARVFPIYWLVTTALFVFSSLLTIILQKDIFSTGYPHTIWAYIQTYTLFPLHFAINPVTWTLSYELFFYLGFGLLIISKRFWIVIAIILGISLYNITMIYPFKNEYTFSYFNFFFSGYNFEFIFGYLIFQFYDKIKFSNWISISMILIAVFIILNFGYEIGDYDAYQRVLAFGVPSALILIVLLNLEKNKSIKIPSFFVTLGDSSYVLYLIHFPMLLFLNKIPQLLGKTLNAQQEIIYSYFMIGFIVCAGIFVHKLIEKPLAKLILR